MESVCVLLFSPVKFLGDQLAWLIGHQPQALCQAADSLTDMQQFLRQETPTVIALSAGTTSMRHTMAQDLDVQTIEVLEWVKVHFANIPVIVYYEGLEVTGIFVQALLHDFNVTFVAGQGESLVAAILRCAQSKQKA